MEEYRAELRERALQACNRAGLPLGVYEPIWGLLRRKLEAYYQTQVERDIEIVKAYYRSK